MCEIYVKADPMLYESRSRSLRIHGGVTKIRLENHFWDILAEIAASDGYTTNQLIAKLYDELLDYRGEIDNFASFLRVSCLRYLPALPDATQVGRRQAGDRDRRPQRGVRPVSRDSTQRPRLTIQAFIGAASGAPD